MHTKQKRPSERYKRKVLARWRWLAARGVELEAAARDMGVAAADLRAWSRGQEVEAPLFVPVQVEFESTTQRVLVVVLAGGVRVEGLTVAEVAELYRTGDVVEVACWAHARRYFFKALSSDPEAAERGLALIKGLFRVERAIKTAPRKKREATRGEKSRPIVDAFFTWCDEQAADVLDDTPIARAIGYARNQRTALTRFLEDGRLPLDNNVSERNLRREVLGRKNWLFLGSDEGARTNTLFASLLASCQLHGIEPWGYLRDLLCLLPSWPKSRVLKLAPAFWKQTRQHEDAQQRLAANVFRAVTLAEHAPLV